MSARERGSTLPEILIACSLLLLFLGGLYLVLIAGQRYSSQVRALNEAQTHARVCLNKMVTELENTDHDTITANATPEQHLIFASTAPAERSGGWSSDGVGNIQWLKWVCYYHKQSSSEVIRVEEAFPAPESVVPLPTSPSYPDFQTFYTAPRQKILARDIIEFQAERDNSLSGGDTIRLFVTAELNGGSDRVTTITLRSLVYPRNGSNIF